MRFIPRSNFTHLLEYDEQLPRFGVLAEKYFASDPVACLVNLREFTTLLAQLLAAQIGLLTSTEEGHYDLLPRLEDQGYLPREIAQLFNEVRRTESVANRVPNDAYTAALSALKISWQLGV